MTSDTALNGIIINRYPSGDADLVLHIIFEKIGKQHLLAKHARRSKKRFGTSLDLFDHGRFEIKQGKGTLFTLSSFIPRDSFKGLRENLTRVGCASVVCETFEALVHEGDESIHPYELLYTTLHAISSAESDREALKAVYLSISHLVQLAGLLGDVKEPTAKNLIALLEAIERHIERKLKTHAFLRDCLGSWMKSEEVQPLLVSGQSKS